MSSFRYSPLIHQDEIRVIELLPGEHDADLRGYMKHIRVSPAQHINGSIQASSVSFQAPDWDDVNIDIVDDTSEPTTNGISTVLSGSFGKVVISQPASSGLNTVWSHSFGEIELSEPTAVRLPNGKVVPGVETFQYTCERRTQYGGYDALSYTWGSPSKSNKINIKGDALAITKNLDAALRGVRSTTRTRVLWVDAICIDQEYVLERNHQVNMMKRIFSQASSVIVWLGSAQPEIPTVDRLIVNYNFHLFRYRKPKILSYSEADLAGLRQLFASPWWKRIWIVQEVVAASEIVIRYGSHFIPWHFLAEVCRGIQANEFRAHPRSPILRTCGYRKFMALDSFRRHGAMLLIRLLQCTREYNATDPRDKIYALLGIANDVTPQDIFPDYTQPPESVYLKVVRFMVTIRKSLDIISSGRLALAAPGVPTWSPDWRVLDTAPPLSGDEVAGHRYSAAGPTTAVMDMTGFPSILQVDGVFADRVDCMGGTLKLARESMSTIRRWHYIAQQNLKARNPDGENWTRLFAQTIIADKNHLGKRASDQFMDAFGAFINGELPDMTAAVRFYADAVTRAVIGRRFFLTKRSRMALGPDDVQLGDMIVVLKGCSVPLVVRAVEGGVVLIGEVYVSGIMNGEVIEDGKSRVTKITLR